MNKFLVAVALLAACASPALAGSAKVRSHHGYNGYSSYPTPDWVRPLPHSERLANALGGWNRGYPGDPYWEPCLSYQRTWDRAPAAAATRVDRLGLKAELIVLQPEPF